MNQQPISILSTLRIINCKAIMNENFLKCTHKFMVSEIFLLEKFKEQSERKA